MTLPVCANRRAFRLLNGLVLLPALLMSSVALTACPSFALRQDDKSADDAKKEAKQEKKEAKREEKKEEKKEDSKDARSYTIQRKFKAGEVDRYNIDIAISGAQDVTLTMLLKNTTKDAKDAGGATVVGEFEKANAVAGGGEQEITGLLPTLVQSMSAAGKLVDLKTEGGSPLFKQLGLEPMIKSIVDIAVYPPNAVKTGDTWEYKPESSEGAQKIKGTATFLGPETVNGVQTYKIKTVSDGEISAVNPMSGEKVNAKTHSEGTQNLDAATGRVVKVQTAVVSKAEGGAGDFIMKFTMALAPADDKAGKDGVKKPDAKPQP